MAFNYQIKNRFSGAVMFEAELDASFERESEGVKLGAAVKLAVKAGADLAGADLAGADLAGAYLAGAYLARANLARANLARANDAIHLGYPNSWVAFAWHREGALMVQVGCRSMTLADGRAYWANKDNRREVWAALDYAETVARLREWPIKEFAKAA